MGCHCWRRLQWRTVSTPGIWPLCPDLLFLAERSVLEIRDEKKQGTKKTTSGGIWPFTQNPGQMAVIRMYMGLMLAILQSTFNSSSEPCEAGTLAKRVTELLQGCTGNPAVQARVADVIEQGLHARSSASETMPPKGQNTTKVSKHPSQGRSWKMSHRILSLPVMGLEASASFMANCTRGKD